MGSVGAIFMLPGDGERLKERWKKIESERFQSRTKEYG